jgi:hypothetical protein
LRGRPQTSPFLPSYPPNARRSQTA